MSRFRFAIRRTAAALVAAVLAGGLAGAALAQDRDRDHGRDHRPPPRHERHRPPPPPPVAWGYDQPTYVQAPPPIVYSAPAPPAAINFGLNLNLR